MVQVRVSRLYIVQSGTQAQCRMSGTVTSNIAITLQYPLAVRGSYSIALHGEILSLSWFGVFMSQKIQESIHSRGTNIVIGNHGLYEVLWGTHCIAVDGVFHAKTLTET